MASQKAAWGLEVGAYAIKAVRLERDGDKVTVTDYSIIPLKRVLATPDIDESEIIRLALGQFISQKALEGEITGNSTSPGAELPRRGLRIGPCGRWRPSHSSTR